MNIGEYTIISFLGEGGFGRVYKVEYQGNVYALKACTSFESDNRERFEREIRYISGIDSPHVVKIYDYNLNHNTPYYVMDLCDSSLKQLLNSTDFRFKVDIALQICRGLQFLHSKGIVHRDINPNNILVKDSVVKISDFGLGFRPNNDQSRITSSGYGEFGTPGYIAPELGTLGAHHASIQSDIYSLGCTLYYWFSGGQKIEYYNESKISNASILQIIRKCRAENPNDRYFSVNEIIQFLEKLYEPSQIYNTFQKLSENKHLLYENELNKYIENIFSKYSSDKDLLSEYRFLKSVWNSKLGLLLANHTVKILSNFSTDLQFDDIDKITEWISLIFKNCYNENQRVDLLNILVQYAYFYHRYDSMRCVLDTMKNIVPSDINNYTLFAIQNKEKLIGFSEETEQSIPANFKALMGL